MATETGNLLIDTFVHPLRGHAWATIAMEPGLSAKELAVRIQEPVGRVRYHLREMRRAGLIELVGERTKRGVVENLYGSAMAPVVTDRVFEGLDADVKIKIAIRVLGWSFGDVERAIRSKAIQEHHLTRVPMRVDRRGWEDLLAVNNRAWEETERVRRESRQRLAGGSEETIPVSSVLLCFHCPPAE